jgi:transposase
MPFPRHSFQEVARRLQFSSEKAMLEDFYTTRGFSIRSIAEALDVAYSVVRERLVYYKIPLRARGQGRNQ